VKDQTTVRDAQAVIDSYQLLEKIGTDSLRLTETPKEKKYFRNVHNFLLVSGALALSAMKEKAEDLGFSARIFSENFEGEARKLGPEIIQQNLKKGHCLLGAGESTVIISGKGRGGRNQEMALSALSSIAENQVLLCLASDGNDNTEAAGAIVDALTLVKVKALNLDPKNFLKDNDSFTFFEKVDDAVITGLTGSNTADFFVFLKS